MIKYQAKSTGVFYVKPLACCWSLYTDIGDAEQSEEEGEEGCGKGEELPVPLEDLKVVSQAGDDGLHAAHLVNTNSERERDGSVARMSFHFQTRQMIHQNFSWRNHPASW